MSNNNHEGYMLNQKWWQEQPSLKLIILSDILF